MLRNTGWETSVVEQISMRFGMCLFTALNYIGERFFAFKEKKDGAKEG